ncbi:phage tail protein [Pseudomonas sp. N40(2020)]|uniref:phage tail protein n=1 Tax=Pseudomonas sp. N40(2020) TaxID=2767798 RepID=UPI001656BA62|nr:phage tail protein [Pseudomonas sp. N40(2020)]MBC8997745.1 phage tail protein [Pseudomonas sp. N40(2020)]
MIIIQELHQFEEGLRPAQPSAAHDWTGEKWELNSARVAELEQQEAERLCSKVDAAADNARTQLAGDPLKAMEYAQAAADAQAYQDAGYPKKEVPLSVAAWGIKGRTARQAADQILGKADQLTDHLLTLRTLRLKAKTQIRTQAAKGKVELARSAADEAIAAIRELVSQQAG